MRKVASIVPFEARLEEARTDVALARAERRPDWSAELSFARRGPDFSHAALLNERGRAWAYLRYLQPQHLHL